MKTLGMIVLFVGVFLCTLAVGSDYPAKGVKAGENAGVVMLTWLLTGFAVAGATVFMVATQNTELPAGLSALVQFAVVVAIVAAMFSLLSPCKIAGPGAIVAVPVIMTCVTMASCFAEQRFLLWCARRGAQLLWYVGL